MVWPVSSDFWKAPLVETKNGTAATQAMKIEHLSTLVTTSFEQRNTCWNTILHMACFYCVFQASGGKREEDVERERHARRRTRLELLACFALVFARLKNCRLQDSALKTATRLALNLPLRRFCPCKANHLSVDYPYIALGFRQNFF